MTDGASIRDEILIVIPKLRAFARSLTNNPDRADDLVQETLLKSLKNSDKFQQGTNLTAWLFTILRNTYYSELRKRSREVEDVDGNEAARLVSKEEQTSRLEVRDFSRAFATLPDTQREALILVGASGFSYEDAAKICGCAVGTIKSRVNRARATLAAILDPELTRKPAETRSADLDALANV